MQQEIRNRLITGSLNLMCQDSYEILKQKANNDALMDAWPSFSETQFHLIDMINRLSIMTD